MAQNLTKWRDIKKWNLSAKVTFALSFQFNESAQTRPFPLSEISVISSNKRERGGSLCESHLSVWVKKRLLVILMEFLAVDVGISTSTLCLSLSLSLTHTHWLPIECNLTSINSFLFGLAAISNFLIYSFLHFLNVNMCFF